MHCSSRGPGLGLNTHAEGLTTACHSSSRGILQFLLLVSVATYTHVRQTDGHTYKIKNKYLKEDESEEKKAKYMPGKKNLIGLDRVLLLTPFLVARLV